MILRVLLLCWLIASGFGGCAAPRPVMQAGWYWMVTGSDDQRVMVLAILNQSAQTQPIRCVIVNPSFDLTEHKLSGWLYKPGAVEPLAPGELLVRAKSAFHFARAAKTTDGARELCDAPNEAIDETTRCLLPVEVLTVTKDGVVHTSMAGGMPNALPDDWLKCPELPEGAASSAVPPS